MEKTVEEILQFSEEETSNIVHYRHQKMFDVVNQ